MSERSKIILAALLDYIKDDKKFTFPPTMLKNATWKKLQDDKQYNKMMEFLGPGRLDGCIIPEISRRLNEKSALYVTGIRVAVRQRAVSSELRHNRAGRVIPYYDHPLETIAAAMYFEDEDRFNKWVIELYGPLIDLVRKTEREEDKLDLLARRRRETVNAPAPLRLKQLGGPLPLLWANMAKKRSAEGDLVQEHKDKKRRFE